MSSRARSWLYSQAVIPKATCEVDTVSVAQAQWTMWHDLQLEKEGDQVVEIFSALYLLQLSLDL